MKKRALINFVLSNATMEGKKLLYEVKFPFDMVLDYAPRSEWLPLLNSLRNGFEENILGISMNDTHVFTKEISRLLIDSTEGGVSSRIPV